MVELTQDQLQALSNPGDGPARLTNPLTNETFVLLSSVEYDRLKNLDYDDSPWTRKELSALAWGAGKQAGWEEMDEYDNLPEKS